MGRGTVAGHVHARTWTLAAKRPRRKQQGGFIYVSDLQGLLCWYWHIGIHRFTLLKTAWPGKVAWGTCDAAIAIALARRIHGQLSWGLSCWVGFFPFAPIELVRPR